MRKELDDSLQARIADSSTLSFAAAGSILLVAMVYAVLIWGVYLPRTGVSVISNITVNATVEFGIITIQPVQVNVVANGSDFSNLPLRSVSVIPIVINPETFATYYLNVTGDNPDDRGVVLQRPGYYSLVVTQAFASEFATLTGGVSCTLVVIRENAPGFLFGTPIFVTTNIVVAIPSAQFDTLPSLTVNQFDFYYNSSEPYTLDLTLSCKFYNNSFEFNMETVSFIYMTRKNGFVPG